VPSGQLVCQHIATRCTALCLSGERGIPHTHTHFLLLRLCLCASAAAPLQVPSIEGFMQQYHMQCPMAYTRLVQVGLPATIEHRKR
jgi:hypothetical protein